jgi:hypothetical protein
MDDLATIRSDVCEFLHYRRELLNQVAVRAQAVSTVMMHFEELAKLYRWELEGIEPPARSRTGAL